MSETELTKREWHYLQTPGTFSIAPCDCGNADTVWSEFEGHCWCERCQKDFKPSHNGIFDGPIPMGLVHALGIRFDRIFINDGSRENYDFVSGKFLPTK